LRETPVAVKLKPDFTSTMDVVMTPEERAEMEAAKEAEAAEPGAGAAAAAAASAGSEQTAEAPGAAPAAAATNPIPSAVAEESNTSLAHHSSFTEKPGQAAPSSTSASTSKTDLAKHDQSKDKKGKPKMSPEQKAQLEALEKKQEAEKQAR